MKKLTPAQQRIVSQLEYNLVSKVGWATDYAKNTVHAPATEALAKAGVVEITPSKEHPDRRLARLVKTDDEPIPPTQPSARPVSPPVKPPPPGGKGQRSAVRRKADAERRAQAKTKPAKPKPIRSVFDPEPEAIKKARTRIKSLIESATAGHPPQAIHLVLAIVNQETGNHAAANALISEYKLDDLFGLRRFS